MELQVRLYVGEWEEKEIIKGSINKDDIRKMTPREWARLQGFPDSFEMPLADTHLYKQFGNSVTVSVIEAIANNIKKVLQEKLGE